MAGKTTRMIQGLPDTGAIVVVPRMSMVERMKRDIFEIRGSTVAAVTSVVMIDGPNRFNLVRCVRRPIHFDHTVVEQLQPHAFTELAEIQYRVNTAADRDRAQPSVETTPKPL